MTRSSIVESLFIVILLWILVTSFMREKVEYKVEFVNINATGTISNYLNDYGNDGWMLYTYKDYNDGRQYIFTRTK